MTPGKVHRILAPETPTEKLGHRRKSDGTLLITESPDIDTIKQTRATPRRASASVALHKKTSFYSGIISSLSQSLSWKNAKKESTQFGTDQTLP